MRWLKTSARLSDGGLIVDGAEPEEQPEADATREAQGQSSATADADTPEQLAASRQRLRTLHFWRQAIGCTIDLTLCDGAHAVAQLRACDGKQEQLYVQGLQTPIGTYRQAAAQSSDLSLVELDGEWRLERLPAARIPRCVAEGSDAHDAQFLTVGPLAAPVEDAASATPTPLDDALTAGKYWQQRRSLFSKYASGVRLDAEGWFSVTPERLAEHIAERCRCDVVLDAFAGVGGNAIQFAFTCERVLAIDLDLARLKLARHNAQVYGVADRIEFIHGDFTALAPRLRADVVFLSPPWGGPGYQAASEFDVATMMGGLDGFELLRLALAISPHVAYYLPRNTASAQLAAMPAMQAGGGYAFETERCVLNGRLKALIAYFGELPGSELESRQGDGD